MYDATIGLENSPRTNSEDRLSALPDNVLCHILSFLDTTYAMATCVLLKRLMNVSCFLSHIILDDSLTRGGNYREFGLDFGKFGLRQILLRMPRIDRFQYACHFDLNDSAVQTLLCYVVAENVEEINIHLRLSTIGEKLRVEIFTCQSLIVLKLWGFKKFATFGDWQTTFLEVYHT